MQECYNLIIYNSIALIINISSEGRRAEVVSNPRRRP